jgi:large subunit ribosomal protein L5
MSDEKPKKQPAQQGAEKAKPAAGKKGEGKKGDGKKGGEAASAPRQSGKREKAVARLSLSFPKEIVPAMMKRFSYSNVMQVPHLEKICVNIGVGQATQDPKLVEAAAHDLEAIVGQKVVITRAKKSISNFHLREKMPIGCRVTLRRTIMYEFLDRFISVTVPRIRDFRGLSDKSFDGRGNFTIGIKEHTIFPEIDVDKITRIFGMDITFVTTAKTDEEAYELLKAFGMPFVKRQEVLETPAA